MKTSPQKARQGTCKKILYLTNKKMLKHRINEFHTFQLCFQKDFKSQVLAKQRKVEFLPFPLLIYHFLGLYLESEKKVLVTQSCLTLCNPMDCRPPGSSVHGILQVTILQWVAIPSQPRDRNLASHIAGRFFTIWATREAPHWKRKVGQKGFLNTSCVQWEVPTKWEQMYSHFWI